MKRITNSLKLVSIAILCLCIPVAAMAAIERAASGTSPYGTSPYGTSPYNMYQYGYAPPGQYGGYSYGVSPYPQQPTAYCVRWVPGQWVPVQVMMPGRWEYRRVWVQGYPMTLYRPVPGYWQRTTPDGTPDLSVWRTSSGGWYGRPYQQNHSGGYFDAQGMWYPFQQPQQ